MVCNSEQVAVDTNDDLSQANLEYYEFLGLLIFAFVFSDDASTVLMWSVITFPNIWTDINMTTDLACNSMCFTFFHTPSVCSSYAVISACVTGVF